MKVWKSDFSAAGSFSCQTHLELRELAAVTFPLLANRLRLGEKKKEKKSSSVTSSCASAAALSGSDCANRRTGKILASTAALNANVCSHHSLSRTGCLTAAWGTSLLEGHHEIFHCECWSEAWWWEQGQNFDQLPPYLASSYRHLRNTDTVELWHLRKLISEVNEEIQDLDCKHSAGFEGSNILHRTSSN